MYKQNCGLCGDLFTVGRYGSGAFCMPCSTKIKEQSAASDRRWNAIRAGNLGLQCENDLERQHYKAALRQRAANGDWS